MMTGSTKEFTPTKKQEACIFYQGGDLLIRGVAGSGKSLVIMKRAVALNKKANKRGVNVRIGVFTFANTLVKYTDSLMNRVGLDDRLIKIATLDSYCLTVYRTISDNPKQVLYNSQKRKEFVIESIQEHLTNSKSNHRLYHLDFKFWVNEFKWIKEKSIKDSYAYINGDRIGRGGQVRLTKIEKKIAFEILEIYNGILASHNYMDVEDCYNYVIDHIDEVPEGLKYDYILVDEAQDLSLVRLMMAKKMTLKAITIAADQAQKIYNTSFTWQDIGINVKGQGSKSLGETFRSTRQIIMLADSLLVNNKDRLSAYGEYTQPILPEKNGPIPVIAKCSNAASEKDLFLKTLKMLIKNNERIIGILCRTHSEVNKIIRWLNASSLHYEKVDKYSDWDLFTPGIKIMTIHSAKGLEVDTVIIPHFVKSMYPPDFYMNTCEPEQIEEMKAQERSLLYVGMTRARNELLITYSGMSSRHLEELDSSLYYTYRTGEKDNIEAVKFEHAEDKEEPIMPNLPPLKSEQGLVKDGDTVFTILLSDKSEHTFIIDLGKYAAQKNIAGKKISEVFSLRGKKYEIHSIAE